MLKRCLVVIAMVVLEGCAADPQLLKGSGVLVTIPSLDDYCARNPENQECGGTK